MEVRASGDGITDVNSSGPIACIVSRQAQTGSDSGISTCSDSSSIESISQSKLEPAGPIIQKKLNSRLKRLMKAKKTPKSTPENQLCNRKKKSTVSIEVCDYLDSISSKESIPTDESVEKKRVCGQEGAVAKDGCNIVALDCEFVGVGRRNQSALGRCSIVDYSGHILCDIYAKPDEPITDYRTQWSGIRPHHMKRAIPFQSAQTLIRNVLRDKVVVGHAVHNDFRVLGIHHPACHIRDTAKYQPLRTQVGLPLKSGVSLKKLSLHLLGRHIQTSEHCSVEDSRASLDLYKLVQNSWEEEILLKSNPKSDTNSAHKRNTPADNEKSFMHDDYWPKDIVG